MPVDFLAIVAQNENLVVIIMCCRGEVALILATDLLYVCMHYVRCTTTTTTTAAAVTSTGFPSEVVCFCVRGLFGLKMEAGMCVVYFPEHMAGQQLFVWKMLFLLPAFMLFLVHTGRVHAF